MRVVGRQEKENDRKLEGKVGLGPPAPSNDRATLGKGWSVVLTTCCLLKPRPVACRLVLFCLSVCGDGEYAERVLDRHIFVDYGVPLRET